MSLLKSFWLTVIRLGKPSGAPREYKTLITSDEYILETSDGYILQVR